MKTIKNIFRLSLVFLLILACEDEDNLDFVKQIEAPSNVSASVRVVPDNSGLTHITPLGNGATSYFIDYGDGSEITEAVIPGESVEHIYDEGVYQATINAISISGLETSVTQDIVVSFRAPENIIIDAQIDASNPFIVNVSATADYAASFLVFFDTSNLDEEGTPLDLDGTVSFEYPAVGDYTIKIVALSGGAETTELEEAITISKPTELPIDFEIFDASVFFGFGGASNAIIDNPDTNGNSSSKVAQIIKGAPEVWAGNVITTSSPIDFSSKKIVKMDVWSPRPGGRLLLKIENLDDNQIFIEKEVTTVGNGEWEEVSFDFSDIDTSNTYQKLVFFFDFGLVGDGSADWTFYIDNISLGVPSSTIVTSIFEDFEGVAPIYTPFGNAEVSVVSNPDISGSNTTSTVTEFNKVSGAEVWAGAFFDVTTPVDNLNFNKVSILSWSPKAGATVRFKIENSADNTQFYEVDAITSTTNAWEELVFDISAAENYTYDRIVIFYDFGNTGDGTTYYFDEITLISDLGVGSLSLLIEDLEGVEPMFTSFGNANVQVINNPDATGENTSSKVAEFDKPNGAEVWAGTFFDIAEPIDLSTYSNITIKSWSPKAGATVRIKIENSADGNQFYEADAITSTTNGWEELSVSLEGASDFIYDRVVIFYDFGNMGDDTKYYFDEITLTN